MALSDRKKKILKAVVDGYIDSASPVSSKEIQQNHLPDCSSATIRNELSALESMGYLTQPHISSGRVPSEKAFRLYVDELMETGPLSTSEIEVIDAYFNKHIDSVEEIVSNVARVLTDITNYTSVVVKSHDEKDMVQSIKLLAITQDRALVVVITDNNVYKDNIVTLPDGIDEKSLVMAQKWLNRLFARKTISEICDNKLDEQYLSEEFLMFRELYEKVLDIIVRMSKRAESDVITEGAGKIFEHIESGDTQTAKNFLDTIEHKQQLAKMFTDSDQKVEFSVKIGQDSDSAIPEGYSVVSAQLRLNDKQKGSAGVIGPVRMNYKKVVSVLDHISKLLDSILGEEE